MMNSRAISKVLIHRQLIRQRQLLPASQLLGAARLLQSAPARNGRGRGGRHYNKSDASPRAYQKRYVKVADENSEGAVVAKATGARGKIESLYKDLDSLLASYQSTLLGDDGVTGDDDYKSVVVRTKELHEKVISSDSISWKQLQDSEVMFRDLCRLLQQLLSMTAVRTSFSLEGAETCFRTLIQLRADRVAMVNRLEDEGAAPATESPSSLASSLTSWISTVFVSSSTTTAEDASITAHRDYSLAPRARHFKGLVSGIFFESNDRGAARADRLYELFELMRPQQQGDEVEGDMANIQPSAVLLLLKAHTSAASFEYAERAEQIWRGQGGATSRSDLFHAVLRAYSRAAVKSSNKRTRSKAAKHVERLVLKAWEEQQQQDNNSNNNNLEGVSTAFVIALEAIVHAGNSIPERCERAESLVIKRLGRRNFAAIFDDKNKESHKRLMTTAELKLLSPLIALYASQGDFKRMEQARQILSFLEQQHDLRRDALAKHDTTNAASSTGSRKRPRSSAKAVVGDDFPSLETYEGMLSGIRSYTFRNRKPDAKREEQPPEWFDLAKYATSFLDRLKALSIAPNRDFYDLLLKIWIRVSHVETGEYAEAILNQMQLREVCRDDDEESLVSTETYFQVLRSWKLSASNHHPDAPARADRLLRFMEAQSGGAETTTTQHGIHSFVYNENVTPDLETYNLVMRVCAYVVEGDDEKRQEAMKIALDTFARLRESTITPDRESYFTLFYCLAHVVPTESAQQDAIQQVLDLLSHRIGRDAKDALKGIGGNFKLEVTKPLESTHEEEKDSVSIEA